MQHCTVTTTQIVKISWEDLDRALFEYFTVDTTNMVVDRMETNDEGVTITLKTRAKGE